MYFTPPDWIEGLKVCTLGGASLKKFEAIARPAAEAEPGGLGEA